MATSVPSSIAVAPLVGKSGWTQRVQAEISRCSPHDSTVLITGPTGTGKELIARAIHRQSPREKGHFIAVDCTTITGALFASQLFGHRRGAFTGADYEALGCFRAAHGGTIFLDEIGDLELDLQAKLLRVLQEHCVVPLGGHDDVQVNARVIAATNRDLKQGVVKGWFREDLYYRLCVVNIETVGLKDRPEDLPLLAEHLLDQLAERSGFPRKQLSPGAVELMATFEWPGNVRQLRHLLEQAVITSDVDLITLPLMQQLLDKARMPGQRDRGCSGGPAHRVDLDRRADSEPAVGDFRDFSPNLSVDGHGRAHPSRPPFPAAGPDEGWHTLNDLECEHIRYTLEHTYYNQSAAARLLGVSRQALIRKIQRHRISLPRNPR